MTDLSLQEYLKTFRSPFFPDKCERYFPNEIARIVIISCDLRLEKSLILTMSVSFTLPAESACNIFLLRHFQLLVFHQSLVFHLVFTSETTDNKLECDIQVFIFYFRVKMKGMDICLSIEIQEPTKELP